ANYAPSVSSVGLIARRVDDVAIAYATLRSNGTGTVQPRRRLLVLRQLVETMCDDETLVLFDSACRALLDAGFTMRYVEIPGWLDGERAAGTISRAEGGRALAGMDAALLSEGLRVRAAAAARLAPAQVDQAWAAARALRSALSATIHEHDADAIVTPTWPFAAPRIEAESVLVRGRHVPVDPHRNCFVRAANAIDACALTLPMGVYPTAEVPAGLHLTAPGGAEARLLAVAQLVEAALPAIPLPPPLRPSNAIRP
ncbi:MAG: amidase family protein, partial [Casimicrobiaceae bacterium]